MSAATTAARREELHRRGVRLVIFTILLSAYVAYEAVGVPLAREGPDRDQPFFATWSHFVSRKAPATMAPDANVITPTEPIAHESPKRSATTQSSVLTTFAL